jgi:hypothetical protein
LFFFVSCCTILLDFRCLTSTNLFHTLYGLHDTQTVPNMTHIHRQRHRITLDDLLVIDFLCVDKNRWVIWTMVVHTDHLINSDQWSDSSWLTKISSQTRNLHWLAPVVPMWPTAIVTRLFSNRQNSIGWEELVTIKRHNSNSRLCSSTNNSPHSYHRVFLSFPHPPHRYILIF